MKKTFIFLLISLSVLLVGCSNHTEDNFSEAITLEIGRVDSNDGNKIVDIAYPIIGGLEHSETISMINSSIQNYVEIQQSEFENALNSTPDTTTPIAPGTITENDSEQENNTADNEDEESAEEESVEEEVVDEESAETETGDSPENHSEPITLTMDFEISYNKNNILNIVESYEKSLGGESENIIGQQSFVFDLNRGVPLTLGELFQFDGEFPEIINRGIEEQINADDSLITFEDQQGFSGISKDANFYFDDKNLYIFYNALEIGPEKNLIPTFHFALKDLEPYLTDEYVDVFQD